MRLFLALILVPFFSYAQEKPYYLSAEDQKYYKNDVMEGNNQLERLNMNVKEINKLHGDIASLRAELLVMKKEMEELKSELKKE